MNFHQRCIRAKILSARLSDQLIAIAVYARYKYPDKVLLTLEDVKALFDDFQLQFDRASIEHYISESDSIHYGPGNAEFSVDNRLLDKHETKYRECLPLTFRARLLTARASFRRWLEDRTPKYLAPTLEIASYVAVVLTILMGLQWGWKQLIGT